MNDFVDHLKASLEKARRHESKLSSEAMRIYGMTSPKIRHLLNNLGSIDSLNYFEIGVHKGATFISALYGNHLHSATAVDNWSRFGKGDARTSFYANCEKFLSKDSYRVLPVDCFSLKAEDFADPVSFYFYDGGHDYEDQYRALTHFHSMLADEFILLVDDFNRPEVQEGTRKAIKDLGLKVRHHQELPAAANGDLENWWNGLYVAVVRK